jgi:predicted metal-dependent hydrolase
MTIHPHLLVRDLLAGAFIAATRAEPDADALLVELERWAEGAEPGAKLRSLRTEEGAALFEASGRLAADFESFAPYLKDRAQRFAAARAWIREDRAEGDALECARAAWDAGLFFEIHELLEPVWAAEQGPERDALQGLIMAAVGLHHLCEGNRAGAQDLLRASADCLSRAPQARDLDLERFARDLAELASRVAEGWGGTADDLERIPHLERRSGD